jgi:hypothetical protein
VLVLGQLVGVRAGDGWFKPGDVVTMAETSRLPALGGVSQALGRLRNSGHVVARTSGGSWSLTPEGHERTRALIGEVDVASVEAEIALVGSAELDNAQHGLIPPELAPVRWRSGIARLLDTFAFDNNVFCMTRFPKATAESDLPDPVVAVIETARCACREHGLSLHLASDRSADDELFGNIAAHMWACKYGVGLFETRFGSDFNDNLQIEVGAMLITGRRVALLKDRDTPNMPTDFIGHIYKSVDFDDLETVNGAVHSWAAEDLGLGRCPSCPA